MILKYELAINKHYPIFSILLELSALLKLVGFSGYSGFFPRGKLTGWVR